MGGPGSGSSELSAEHTRKVNIAQEHHHQQASTGGDNSCKKGKKKGAKMPQYRPRKGGAAGGAFDDGTINGDYRRPRRIRKR